LNDQRGAGTLVLGSNPPVRRQTMANEPIKRKQFLFVDDDPNFLNVIRELFLQMAGGSWEIFTAQNHAQALAVLREERIDVVVVDLDMPVMDGLQFLRLLGRTHPGQQAAVLSGRTDEATRKACLEGGAALYLQKVIEPQGFATVFSALDALAGAAPQEGFRGVMRRMGLQEVLQMECLSHKSSVLEIFTGKVRGRIFISEGSLVHAESGALQGEVALYGLLGLRGGEFNFLEYTEPPRRTIEGHWENLLMEAARLSDEGRTFFEPETPEAALELQAAVAQPPAAPSPEPPAQVQIDVQIEEILLCSGAGDVLYEWGCDNLDERLHWVEQVEHQARQLGTVARVGLFDRLEILTRGGRIVCQVQPQRRVFVRSARRHVP
jgi:DNA-binding NarL/FixJ family response regulator